MSTAKAPAPQHSNLVGGSSAGRAIACPWSIANRHLALPDTGSDYAREGTALHRAIEMFILEEVAEIGDIEGMTVEGVTLTNDHAALVGEAYTLYDAFASALEAEEKQELLVLLESKVGFGSHIPEAWGTADLIGRCGKTAVVLDWKFGSGVEVRAKESAQGLFYAAAARRTHQHLFEGIERVAIVIVQPAWGIDVWYTTPEALGKFERTLRAAIRTAESGKAKAREGDHCKWCPVKHACPEKQDLVRAALHEVANKVDDLRPDQLAHWLDRLDSIEDFTRHVRDAAHKMAEAGVAIPGYVMVPKRATRVWADESKAAVALMELGCMDAELFPRELVSPAQAEKVLKPKKLKLPEGLTVSVSSGLKLVKGEAKPEGTAPAGVPRELAALMRFA